MALDYAHGAVTLPMDIRDCQDGVPSLLLLFSLVWQTGSDPVRRTGLAVNVSNPKGLSEVLNSKRDLAFLFRDLATLRTDLPLFAAVDDLLLEGSYDSLSSHSRSLGQSEVFEEARSAFLLRRQDFFPQ